MGNEGTTAAHADNGFGASDGVLDGEGQEPAQAGQPIDLGLGDPFRWREDTRPGPVAPNQPRGASTTGGLAEGLDKSNRDLGLGFGGPVASAFHAARSTAPVQGLAVFEATFDGSGRVESVRIVSAQRPEEWNNLAADAARHLKRKPIRTPRNSRGLSITVRVEARVASPAGRASAAGVFDLSDLGARELRIVSVRVINERRL